MIKLHFLIFRNCRDQIELTLFRSILEPSGWLLVIHVHCLLNLKHFNLCRVGGHIHARLGAAEVAGILGDSIDLRVWFQ